MSTKSRPDASALIHGTTWRAVSLGSKLAFLALIVPRTVPGEYGLFFSYSSLALLVSRILSFGAIDHLPTLVRGDYGAMRRAVTDVAPITVTAIATTGVAAAIESPLAAALALALSMASGLMLAGAVRSVWPAWFERWLNLHPVLLLILALLLGMHVNARELLLCQSGAILLSQLVFARAATVGHAFPRAGDHPVWSSRMTAMLKGGQSRMASDVLVAGCIRGVAISPLLFGSGAVSDSVALALALGEAVWTIGMILVHRNFSYYCASGPDLRAEPSRRWNDRHAAPTAGSDESG